MLDETGFVVKRYTVPEHDVIDAGEQVVFLAERAEQVLTFGAKQRIPVDLR